MPVILDSELPVSALPGIEHRTVAGREQGVRTMEVWKQTIAPGVATPVHRHNCDEVVVIMAGCGELTEEGETRRFGAGSTLIVHPGVVHQIVNTGEEPVLLIAALGTSPVRVRDAEGERIPLPWDAPD